MRANGIGVLTNPLALVIASVLFVQPLAGQSTSPGSIPPCPASPDDALNYPDNMVRPKYPRDALRKGTAGIVELRAVVTADSRTKDISILSGEPEFSKPAILAIQEWRFHAQVRNGHPLESTYKIQVRFNPMLQEANSSVELESPIPASSIVSDWGIHKDRSPDIHRMSEAGMVPPKQLYAPEPEFSEKARIEQQQGNVGIDLVVGTDGLPTDLHIACSSAPDLNNSAMATVKQWKFAPATKDGRPVPVGIVVEVSFKLYNNSAH